ncbi:hypothetical protein A2U01_0075630, partial [Trifolium medium]|nr:hypothetical protein [Trifolium medium]
VPIPNKGEASATGGGVEETVLPSPKKHKGPTVHKGRTIPLLTGSTAAPGELGGGDKILPTAAAGLGVVQPSASHIAPVADSGAAPSLWDPMFDPM